MSTRTTHLTVAEVAQRLGVTPSAAYKMVYTGKLGAVRWGRRGWAVPVSALNAPDFQAYLRWGSRRRKPKPDPEPEPKPAPTPEPAPEPEAPPTWGIQVTRREPAD